MDLSKRAREFKVDYLTADQINRFKNNHLEFDNYIIKNKRIFPRGLKKGDIVTFFEDKNNYGKTIFDGEIIEPLRDNFNLNSDSDEFKIIPQNYTLDNFPPKYWSEIIKNNSYIWSGKKFHSIVINSIKTSNEKTYIEYNNLHIILDKSYLNNDENTNNYHNQKSRLKIRLDELRTEDNILLKYGDNDNEIYI